MKISRTGPLAAVTGVALLWSAAPARAACSDDVASLEQNLNAEGRTAGAASSSGQADAATRGAKAEESSKTDTPVADLPKPPTADNEKATQAAAAAGGGGEGVMSAKVSLNAARNAAKKGDEAGCLAAVAKAKTQMKM